MSSQQSARPARGRPNQQARALATRHQIILGAAQTFEATGYDGATLAMIVEAAGVSRGALYFHFQTKEDIGRAVVEEQHAASIQLVGEISSTGAPAIEQIVMLCQAMAQQIVSDPIVRAGIRLTLEQTFTEKHRAPYLGWIGACHGLLEQAKAEGDVGEWVNPDELANFVIPAFTGVQMVSHVLADRKDLSRRIDVMWQYLLPSILVESQRERIDEIVSARATIG